MVAVDVDVAESASGRETVLKPEQESAVRAPTEMFWRFCKPVSEEGLTIHFAKSPGLLLSNQDSAGYRTHILNLPTSPESSACDFFNYTSQTTRKIQRIWNSPKDVLMTYKHS